MALTKIGIIFYQHLGFTIRAKDYFKEAMDLATVLTGNKYTNQWYLELTSTMRKIQDAAQKAEDEKWENKRKPFMEQLEKDGTIAKLWVGKAYSIKGLFLKINSYCFSAPRPDNLKSPGKKKLVKLKKSISRKKFLIYLISRFFLPGLPLPAGPYQTSSFSGPR